MRRPRWAPSPARGEGTLKQPPSKMRYPLLPHRLRLLLTSRHAARSTPRMDFSQNAGSQQWEADAPFRGRTIHVRLDPSLAAEKREVLAQAALKQADAAWSDVEKNLLRSLHALYNDAWSDPDEGFPTLSEAEFLERITLGTIVVHEPDAMSLYFDDGDLFGGHAIDLYWSGGTMHDATLVR
jgi:Uncharacterized protein conserved in bacteria (DUF2262)